MAGQEQTSNYSEQGGAREVIGGSLDIISGGDLDIESGADFKIAGTKVSASAAELDTMDGITASTAELNNLDGYTGTLAALNEVDNAPVSFTFGIASAGADVSEITVTVKDADGNTVAIPLVFTLWLSDANTGVALTGTSASGTVQAKAASGADFSVLSAKKAIIVQALATGVYILEITDSAKTAFYVCAQAPNGTLGISAALQTGDYG